ncbi:MAG: hypothetical protein A2Y22_08870 [Clostridiales bacterium GWD2_32_59]|nr:MAG: hypothetical protein A2Y22_08870 [Clostridiales bacterium GWD2_32_59]
MQVDDVVEESIKEKEGLNDYIEMELGKFSFSLKTAREMENGIPTEYDIPQPAASEDKGYKETNSQNGIILKAANVKKDKVGKTISEDYICFMGMSNHKVEIDYSIHSVKRNSQFHLWEEKQMILLSSEEVSIDKEEDKKFKQNNSITIEGNENSGYAVELIFNNNGKKVKYHSMRDRVVDRKYMELLEKILGTLNPKVLATLAKKAGLSPLPEKAVILPLVNEVAYDDIMEQSIS